MKISAEEIKKIALLSRLEVKEDQIELSIADLDFIGGGSTVATLI